ncbi:MAG: LCP family protein [Actinomycetota bacterium]|nr:LCP family protein [Actinomycetota bacterium]
MSENQFYYKPNPAKKSGAHRTPKKKNIALRRTGFIFVTAAVVIAMVAGGAFFYAKSKFNSIKKVSVAHLDAQITDQPINILLVGNNSRSILNGKQASAFGTGAQVGGARSDVTMIAHLDPKTKTVTLVSIPRDLFLPIPGSTKSNRVDAALNQGPGQLVATIEQDLGIPIQHYAELNFDSFQSLVNALGGLYMYFPYYVKDAQTGLNITQKGCIYLNGTQALALVRSRELYYSADGVNYTPDGLGDLSRIRRDHEFLKVLASQVKQKGISNPLKLNSILSSIFPYLSVDSSFTFNQVFSIASTFRSITPSNVGSVTLPIAFANNYTYAGANYGDVVFAAQPQDMTIIQQSLGIAVPSIPKNSFTVSVLNGTGTYNQAKEVATGLGSLGYNVTSTGNTTVYGNSLETVVRYQPGRLQDAQRIMADLSGPVVMGMGSITTGTDVEVITGNQLTVASTSSPTTTNATSNSTSNKSTATQVTSTAPAITAPVTLPATQSNQALQPWDPRACPTQAG